MMPSSKSALQTGAEADFRPLPEVEFEIATADLVGDILDEVARVMEVESMRTGMTKSRLADRMNIDKASVTKILKGQRNLTIRSLARLIRSLDHVAAFRLTPLYSSGDDNHQTELERTDLVLPSIKLSENSWSEVSLMMTSKTPSTSSSESPLITTTIE